MGIELSFAPIFHMDYIVLMFLEHLMICEYCDQGVHLSCLHPVPDKRPKVSRSKIAFWKGQ